MPSADSTIAALPAQPRKRMATSRSGAGADLLLYALIAGLVAGAWAFSRRGYFAAGDDIGYWLGVAGGVMMLLLFSYPLRKHFKSFHRWGKVKWWLLVHMVLGIGGPLLILVHSTFRVGSVNAAVALYSMLIVAGSGVIGRFLYVRVNGGLHGQAQSLRQLQARLGLNQAASHSKLAFAPEVEARLQAFEARELGPDQSLLTATRQLLLPLQAWWTYRECKALLKAPLAALGEQLGWRPSDLAKQQRLARGLILQYLRGVVGVAQFSVYARLFALWHVAHVPFVYLLIISAIAHVIAVHAY
ncbi:MAG: hypothetical protein ABI574_10180 [Burkholderiales bacterium]